MKKLLLFMILCLFGGLYTFAQVDTTSTSTSTVVDTSILSYIINAVLVFVVGHFVIPSKWASPIQYLLVVLKGIVTFLEAANKSNTTSKTVVAVQNVSAQDEQSTASQPITSTQTDTTQTPIHQ